MEVHSFRVADESPDMGKCGQTLELLFKTKVSHKVTSLAWSPHGADAEDKKLGVLIGGLDCGNLVFWSPIESPKNMGEESLNNYRCLLNKDIGEQSPITCLAVNPHKRNLVVSGGSTVLIHNVDRACSNIDSFAPAQVTADTSTVTSVGWNWKVAHIFASAADNGVATVWDLKNKKAIMNLADQNYSLDMFSADSLQ